MIPNFFPFLKIAVLVTKSIAFSTECFETGGIGIWSGSRNSRPLVICITRFRKRSSSISLCTRVRGIWIDRRRVICIICSHYSKFVVNDISHVCNDKLEECYNDLDRRETSYIENVGNDESDTENEAVCDWARVVGNADSKRDQINECIDESNDRKDDKLMGCVRESSL